MSRLSSEHTLAQHESKSQLHLTNLKNLTVVAKGRAFLAQIINLSRRSSHEPSTRPFMTMKLGGFNPPNGPSAEGGRSSMDPLPEPVIYKSSRTNDRYDTRDNTILIDPRSSTIGPLTESQDHRPNKRTSSLEIIEVLRPEKGKGPARRQSIERHLAARRPPPSTIDSRAQPLEQRQTTTAPLPLMNINADPLTMSPSPPLEHLLRPFHLQAHSAAQATSDDDLKCLIQTFLSATMTLAKKYVDDHHPEVVPHLHRLIHDSIEFPVGPAMATGGDGRARAGD